MLIITKMIPPVIGNDATPDIPATAFIIMFAGIHSNNVIPIPNNPATNPTINVSALNTLDMSLFEAPIALSIPIYFVLSSTDIYVIIPIMIDDTDTNAINT